MKIYLVFPVCFILFCTNLYSQDKIILNGGKVIECKILKTDSTMIYYSAVKEGNTYNSSIRKNHVADIRYGAEKAMKGTKVKNSQNYRFNFAVDPAGFIMYGPACLAEVYVKPKNSDLILGIFTGLRANDYGFLYQLHSHISYTSVTVPIGLKIYTKSKTKADGFFLGPHFELGNFIGLFGAELGYKWQFKNRISLEISDWIAGIWYDPIISDRRITSPNYFSPYLLSVKIGVSL